MNINAIGKYEMLGIVNAVDTALIERYGLNMLDACVTRREALTAYDEYRCPLRVADVIGCRLGIPRIDLACVESSINCTGLSGSGASS